MSHADKVRDELREMLKGSYGATYAAGAAFAQTQKEVANAPELDQVMSAALSLIVAAEGLKDAAEAAEKSARTALATAIQETGAPEVITLHHKAYMSSKAAFVSVEQPDMVPADFWNQPTPNKKAIKEAIERGEDVPGCTLIRPNGQTLNIRSRK